MREYLVSPKQYVPGTKMSFAGLRKPEDIENVIAYLLQETAPPATN
jgi:cytochrome c